MKRKVLISVLTVALVLTLCIGLFAACDKTPAEPSQYKVTYDLGEYTGTEAAPAEAEFESGSKTTLPTLGFTWDKHKFTGWKAGEGALLQPGTEVTVTADITYVAQWAQFTADDYIGAWEGDRFHVEITKNGEAFQIEYDSDNLDLVASTSDQGGYTFHVAMDTAFDYDPADYHIWLIDGGAKLAICVAGQEADYTELTRAATFTEAYLGEYTGTAAEESLLAEIESASITLRLPVYGMLRHSFGSSTSKLEYAENGYLLTTRFMGEEGWENVTLHIYLDANNSDKLYVAVVTNDTDGTPYELTRKAGYTITVHYTLGTEEKTATVNTMSGDGDTYYINNPLETLDDGADLMEQLEIGEFYEFYYYDADAADKKGEKFDIQSFTATGDFDIIITKASVGTLATSIDAAWYGSYTGNSFYGQPFTLEISDANGGTITLNDSMQNMVGQIGESILTNQGKLILAYFDEWQGGYTYYYFTRNAEEDSIQMTSDSGDVTFTRKAETPEGPTATVYYMLNGTLKSAPANVEASGDAYKLVDPPEWAIPEDGGEYNTFMDQLAFGKKLEYFKYNSATSAKEGTFDSNATFTEDISILVEFTTFATAADSIATKYEGTFNGTCTSWGDFTLTINATDGTITLAYLAGTPNSVEASVEDGKIFTETDGGRLVFVEGSSAQYAHYYYLKEEGGAYTLECEYYTATLTKEGEEPKLTYIEYTAAEPYSVQVGILDKTTVTINKVLVSTDYTSVKLSITVDGQPSEIEAAQVKDQTTWWNNNRAGSKKAEKEFEGFDFKYNSLSMKIDGAAIFADHSLLLLDDISDAIDTLYTSSEYVDPYDHEQIPAGKYALSDSKYITFEADWKFTMLSNLHGTYSWDAASNSYKGTADDGIGGTDSYTFTLDGKNVVVVCTTFSSYNGTYAPYVEPDWAEYKGDITVTRGENSARLVYIKLNRNDLLNSITFKLYGNDKEYTAKASDPADAGFEGYLAYFKLDDGSLSGSLPPYPQVLIKYGKDNTELTIADGSSTSYTNPTVLGTLSTTGTMPTPPAQEITVKVYGGEHGSAEWSKEIKVSKGSHSLSDIIALLGEDLPEGENQFWYFNGYFKIGSATGENWNDKYTPHDFQKETSLYAQFNDINWYAGVTDRNDYPQLEFAHLGATTGKVTFYKNESDRGTELNYTYDTSDYSVTISLEDGTSFKGTFGKITVNGSFRYIVINITLTIGEKEYTFGTGSPTTGGGYQG